MSLINKGELIKQYLAHLLSYELNCPLGKPSEINFQITNRCPLDCKMCNIPVQEEKEDELLSLDEIKQIMDQIYRWAGNDRYISFVGGEALVREKTTLGAIRYAKELGFHTSLVTSGYLLTDDLCQRLLATGLDRVSVSLDGPDEKTHDKIRGDGSYQKARGALKKLNQLRKDQEEDKRLKLDINTVIMSYNFHKLPEIHQLALEMGIDEIFFQSVVPDNRYQEIDYLTDVWIGDNDLGRLNEVIKSLISLKKEYGMISNSVEYLKEVPAYFKNKGQFNGGKCLAGYMNLNIAPDGRLTVCGFGPNVKITEGDIEALWKSQKFRETRKKIKNCKKPCMMLCYRKSSLKELINQIKRE